MSKIMCLIIHESLTNPEILNQYSNWVKKTYTHLLGGTNPVRVSKLSIPYRHLYRTLFELIQELKPKGYFIHFIVSDIMYVLFPLCLFVVKKNDPISAKKCRDYGNANFDIPTDQMKFEALFKVDHPNAH